MNRELLHKLIRWPRPYLTRTELVLIIDRSYDACGAIIRRAIQQGYLQRLQRGLYSIASKAGADKPDMREIAQLLYGPSYISFESALSWHGWIPEGVKVLCSATIKRSKEVTTPIGTFVYERIPKAAFAFGVHFIKTETGSFLMAEGWKSLADLIYTRKLGWANINEISEDLRIEQETFASSDLNLLKQLATNYPNQRVRHYLNCYCKELGIWR